MIQQSIEIGPIHEFLPGMMRLGLGLCGDEIESVDAEFGYLSKNLLENAKGKYLLDAQIRLSRLDPESAPMIDTLFSFCLEEATGTVISDRAVWIREVVMEVCDQISALRYLALMSKRLKLEALTQVILRHREDLLDLLELLTGSRFGYDYVVPGGVRFDLSHGFSERLEKWIKNYRQDFARIEAMFYWVGYHDYYIRNIGGVVDSGKLGFISRADKEETRLGPVSTVKTRLNYVLASTLRINERLSRFLTELVPGEFRVKISPQLTIENVSHQIETLRGEWHVSMKLNPQLFIENITVKSPSDETISALPEALIHESLDDLPLIIQSLNFSIAEIDK